MQGSTPAPMIVPLAGYGGDARRRNPRAMADVEVAGGVEIDTSRWPLLVITAPAGCINDEDWHAFLTRIDQLLGERESHYASVVDLSKDCMLTPKQRGQITADNQRCVAQALVFTSTLLSNLLTAIMWLRRPPFPVRVFTEIPQAIDWACRELAADKTRNSRPSLRMRWRR